MPELVIDHHDRIAEDNKPDLSLLDTIDMAYHRGLNEGMRMGLDSCKELMEGK